VTEAPSRLDARSLRDLVLDAGSWTSWDAPVPPRGVDDAYARELAAAAEKTRQDESIITGEGTLCGRRVAVVAGEFGFLAGSIGVAAAERLIAAVERATEEGLPLLAAPVSGGTRMQEGTVAFLQMIGITAAIARHKEAGLPYLVYLRNPTFGGVLASWGSLGHVTIAEPGASIGFLGPRVYQALYGEPGTPTSAGQNAQAGRTAPTPTTPRTTAARGRWLRRPGGRTARACAGCSGPLRPTWSACPAPGPARRIPASSWRWPASAARRASSSGRTGEGRACRHPSVRRHCAKPDAGCIWPRSSGSHSSP
jgi:hypothetical protein